MQEESLPLWESLQLFWNLNSAYQPQAKSNFAIFSEALLTEQVSSREWGWIVVSKRKGCNFCSLFRLQALWCTFSGGVINLVSLELVLCHQPLLCWPCLTKCVGLNKCTMPRTLFNFRAGRHNRSLAKSAVCLQCSCWPLSNPWSLFHFRWCHIFGSAWLLQWLYCKCISFHLKTGLSASSLYHTGRHQLKHDVQCWKNVSCLCKSVSAEC